MKSITFKIIGMHCTSCAINIDGELEDFNGIKRSQTNYIKQTTQVDIESDQVNVNDIVNIIKNLGYDAELVT